MDRVVHVPRRFAQDVWGGTESVILNLCRQQVAAGFLPEIHTSRALCDMGAEVWNEIPIRRYAYQYPFLGLSRKEKHAMDLKAGNLISLPLFWNLMRLPDVRVFHAHVIGRMGGEVMTAARLRKKPCLVTLHGNVFDVPEAERSAGHAEVGKKHLEWGKVFGMLFRSRKLLEEADAVLCVGYSEYVAAKKALPHERVHYLANGVNPEAFAGGDRAGLRAELGFAEDDFVFGCISRIDPQKGQHLLVEALGRLASEHPRAKLLLAGPVTDPGYGEELEAAVDRLGLAGRVRLLGSVEPESARHVGMLAALDAFVLPSRHEPFGIVVLEAWAAGKPVIVSEVGGLQRLVDGGEDGLFFESGDVDGLATQMAAVIGGGVAEKLAAAGHAKMLREYTWKKVADDLEGIYRGAEERAGS
ncbi:MAG: glycosyltransferase involved in cell wall biosynthesis [Verrucomicrobiales bacterium]|jgi:glycosyltransferase involved in cell wall biosynthesis